MMGWGTHGPVDGGQRLAQVVEHGPAGGLQREGGGAQLHHAGLAGGLGGAARLGARCSLHRLPRRLPAFYVQGTPPPHQLDDGHGGGGGPGGGPARLLGRPVEQQLGVGRRLHAPAAALRLARGLRFRVVPPGGAGIAGVTGGRRGGRPVHRPAERNSGEGRPRFGRGGGVPRPGHRPDGVGGALRDLGFAGEKQGEGGGHDKGGTNHPKSIRVCRRDGPRHRCERGRGSAGPPRRTVRRCDVTERPGPPRRDVTEPRETLRRSDVAQRPGSARRTAQGAAGPNPPTPLRLRSRARRPAVIYAARRGGPTPSGRVMQPEGLGQHPARRGGWALNYGAKLRSGEGSALPLPPPPIWGNFSAFWGPRRCLPPRGARPIEARPADSGLSPTGDRLSSHLYFFNYYF